MFIIKKSFIIILFIVFLFISYNLNSKNKEINDYGIVTLMYHRFDENKYPSTNIRMSEFNSHIEMIKDAKMSFVDPKEFESSLNNLKLQRKILITIDDGFLSFYNNAWPVLKKNKIPFILFISTREVGKNGYMSWDQIKEVSEENYSYIGNHSHTHEYLIDEESDIIEKDLSLSMRIFKEKLGSNSMFFSYPFGEYSLEFKKIVKDLGFKFAFGQHSGVIDETKDFLELPRFPINEKYWNLKRFSNLLKTLPFQYKSIEPKEKYINDLTNPPKVKIEFYNNINNLNLINCFSNEQDKWRKSKINFYEKNKLEIELDGKFTTERGRINCSLKEENGFYRWLGTQFVIAEK
tara:strand:- start:577 stop:1623 length:1047 start_codon:yes stop_codon:yes gene_type:complete